MRKAIKQRLDLAKEMAQRPWFRTVLIIWAVIGAWDTFISEILPEKIAADAPRVYKIIFWLLDMTSGWLSLHVWLLIGAAIIAVGSIEFAFRLISEEKIRTRYLQPPSNTEKDRLDYLVEGIDAINDITKAIYASNRDTIHLSKIINRYAILVPLIASPKLKRWMLARSAAHINAYSSKVQKTAELIGAVTPVVSENQTKFIEGSTVTSEREKLDLKNFIDVLEVTRSTTVQTVKSLDGMRESSKAIKGITGDLNAASSRLYLVIGTLIEKVNDFRSMCKHMQTVAAKKLAAAEETQ